MTSKKIRFVWDISCKSSHHIKVFTKQPILNTQKGSNLNIIIIKIIIIIATKIIIITTAITEETNI